MIKKIMIFTLSFIVMVLLSNCDNNPSSSNKKNSDGGSYILCEGNFQTPTASLWQYDNEGASGPVCWDLDSNPLGDTGQSLCYVDGKLFVIVNVSSSIKVLDMETNEEIASIPLPGISPRYMDIDGKYGYVSGWNSYGIIKIDVENYTILDTIPVDGLSEDIIIKDDKLYTSITMNAYWGSENKVVVYDISQETPVVVNTYEVIAGPGQMLMDGTDLWVASTYYDDAWQTFAGMSKIDLNTGEVTKRDYGVTWDFSKDLMRVDNSVYRGYQNGIVKIDNQLNYSENDKIGNLPGMVYSSNTHNDKIYCGVTDYTSPDTVYVLDLDGEILETIKVGALPTDISFVE